MPTNNMNDLPKELVTVVTKPYKRYVATKPSGLKWSSLGATVKYWLAY